MPGYIGYDQEDANPSFAYFNNSSKNGGIVGPKNENSLSKSSGVFSVNESFKAIRTDGWANNKFDGSSPEKAAKNALQVLDYKPTAPNGYYWIRRVNNAPIQVYCDMVRDGGGWMLLNGNTTTVSVNKGSASWSGDYLNVGIQETGCGNNPLSYRLLNIPFEDWSQSRLLMRRVSTIAQCSGTTYSGGTKTFAGYYTTTTNSNAALEQYSGVSSAVSNSTCTWNDGNWANGTNANTSFNRVFWVFTASGTKITPSHSTSCSPGSGSHVHRWYVK